MNNFLEMIAHYNSILNGIVWGIPMLCLIIGTGIFMSIRTGFFQITHVKDVYDNTIKGLFSKDSIEEIKNEVKTEIKTNAEETKKHTLSQFQALSTALASTIGTGNIAGVSTAIVVGGPGAVFWMWICAIFGMITHFSEVILGIYYRDYDKNNGYSGGPMYYISNGIGRKSGLSTFAKVLATLFATFTFIAVLGTGNMTQINSISEALKANFGVPSLICGIVVALISSLIIIGGIKRIGIVAEKLVPFMAIFYIIVGLIIVIMNYKNVPFVFSSIFSGAFSLSAIGGGTFGYVIKRAMTYGFKRGAFSNEAGLGTSVMAHSATEEKEPVKQGLWGIFEVFFDTIIVCTFTALIVLSSTLNAPSIDTALENMPLGETIVCIDDSLKNEDGEILLVDNNYYMMPIKIDQNNNAVLYKTKPTDGKNYREIVIDSQLFYAEELSETEANDNSFFYGNVLKVYPNSDGDGSYSSIHIENVTGVSLVTLAVSNKLSHIAGKVLAIAVTLFAFTTILGWSYYGTKSVEYLFGKKATYIYKVLFIIFIVIGSTVSLNLAWDISDTFNGLMAIPNLIGVLFLSGTVIKIIKNYYDRKNGINVKPMISYKDE